MKNDKRYISQFSKEDMKELAKVANIQQGLGIVFTKTEDKLEVSVDRHMLTLWVQDIIAGKEI